MRDLKAALAELRDMAGMVRGHAGGEAARAARARVLTAAGRRSIRAVERAGRAFHGLYLEPCGGG